MSKALLVVEAPSKCESCQFVYFRPIEEKETVEYFCALDFHEVKELAERNNCPLKLIPTRYGRGSGRQELMNYILGETDNE